MASPKMKADSLKAELVKCIARLENNLQDRLCTIDLKIDSLLQGRSQSREVNHADTMEKRPRRASQMFRGEQSGNMFAAQSGNMFTARVPARLSVSSWTSSTSTIPPPSGEGPVLHNSSKDSVFRDRTSFCSWTNRVSMFDPEMARQRSLQNRVRRRPNGGEVRKVAQAGLSADEPGRGMNAIQSKLLKNVGSGWSIYTVQAWEFLENPESSYWAAVYAKAMWIFTLITVCTSLFQTGDPPPLPGLLGGVVELTIDVVFSIEILARFLLCPFPRQFFMVAWNWVDIVAALPSLVMRFLLGPFIFDEEEELARNILLCTLPVLRLLRLLRHFEQFNLLRAAFEDAFEALPVLIFTLVFIVLVTATLMFLVEPRDNIPTLPRALWLSVVTLTTVGYGDVVPKSSPGTILTCLMVICGVLYMAMPLGIIGSAFCNIWNDRDRILLIQRTREQLKRWDFTPTDIPVLFNIVDKDGNGRLCFREFVDLLRQMRIGLAEKRMMQLFSTLDVDDSGEIDAQEFVRSVFPEAYHDIYGAGGQSLFESPERLGQVSVESIEDEPSYSPRETAVSSEMSFMSAGR